GWSVWYVLVWLFVMWTGIFYRPSLELTWKLFMLAGKTKSRLKSDVKNFIHEIETMLSGH
ncbi:MAG TPA: hypothetical protein VGK46_03100, partial [Saprospiraceae bacterium]